MAGEEAERVLRRSQRWITSSPREQFAARFGWCRLWFFTIRVLVFRTGGPGLLTTSRDNDCELYRPAAGAGLTL